MTASHITGPLFLGTKEPAATTVLAGAGTAAAPEETTGAYNFLDFRGKSTAASGDARLLYALLLLGGAVGGEAVRAYARASAANVATGGTINGMHASMAVDAGASVSGAGNAIRATLDAAAESRTLTGTLSAIQVDSNIGTGNTLPATHAFLRFTNTGAVSLSNLMEIPNVASGGMLAAHTTQTLTHSIRFISADGSKYYLMCTNVVTNRTGGA